MFITFDNMSADDDIHNNDNAYLSVYPNPYHRNDHHDMYISFSSTYTHSAPTFLIYNTRGQFVRSLSPQEALDGFVETLWNGNDEFGVPVQSGIYFIAVIQDQNITDLRKIIILR